MVTTATAGFFAVVGVETLWVVVDGTTLGVVVALCDDVEGCDELIRSPTSCCEAIVVGAALSPDTVEGELSRTTEATGTIANVTIRTER
jgi:hypothetical protein